MEADIDVETEGGERERTMERFKVESSTVKQGNCNGWHGNDG